VAIVEFIKNIFRYHKAKIFLFVVLSLVFSVVYFPYNDLSDKISAIVSEQTGNSVYLQFDDLSLGFLPQPGLKMTNVLAETAMASDIRAKTVRVAPSILGLLTMKPHFGKIQADDLFKGNLNLSLSNSSKIKAPMAVNADLDYIHFDIKQILKTFPQVPITATGNASLTANIDADLDMQSQPEGDFALQGAKILIPAFSLNLPQAGGDIALPKLTLEKLLVKGKLKNGKLIFNDTMLGTTKDDLYAKIGGDIDLRVTPGSGAVINYYNLVIDFTIKENLKTQLGSYMALLDGMFGRFKSQSLDGSRYTFRMQFNPFNDPMPIFSSANKQ
jgi:type II secretion system protein N